MAVLLRVGVGYVALGVLSGLLRPLTAQKGALNAVVTVVVVFVVGIGIMYYDLGIHPPEYGTPLTPQLLVTSQLELLLITLPIPAGYLAGILTSNRTDLLGIAILPATMVVGAVLGTIVSLSQGSAPGFTRVLFFVATFATSVFALLPMGVMMWLDPRDAAVE
jgi:hypothetical protein